MNEKDAWAIMATLAFADLDLKGVEIADQTPVHGNYDADRWRMHISMLLTRLKLAEMVEHDTFTHTWRISDVGRKSSLDHFREVWALSSKLYSLNHPSK
jgi:hypothetical protein